MVNQTTVGKEKKYPERFVLPDELTGWDVEAPSYVPLAYPEFESIQERLAAKGVEIANMAVLARLAQLTTAQAAEIVGPAIADVRHPLGRTGINGTGIYYEAGKSQTADLVAVREKRVWEYEISTVYNRGKWRLPGGFIDNSDNGDLRDTAWREGQEELGIDFRSIPIAHAATLFEKHVKPNSSRSVDMGFVENQVEIIWLADKATGDDIKAGDDAEDAKWQTYEELAELAAAGRVSKDHFDYIREAFRQSDVYLT